MRVCKKLEDLVVGLHLLIFGANAEVVNIVCLSVVSPDSHHDKAQSKVCGHLSIHNACLRGDAGRRASASEWCKPASTVSPTDPFAAPLSSFACHITEAEEHSSNRGVAQTCATTSRFIHAALLNINNNIIIIINPPAPQQLD